MEKKLGKESHSWDEEENELAGVLGRRSSVVTQLQLASHQQQEEEQARKGAACQRSAIRLQLEKQLGDQRDALAASRASEKDIGGQLEASDVSARVAMVHLLQAKKAAAARKTHSK